MVLTTERGREGNPRARRRALLERRRERGGIVRADSKTTDGRTTRLYSTKGGRRRETEKSTSRRMTTYLSLMLLRPHSDLRILLRMHHARGDFVVDDRFIASPTTSMPNCYNWFDRLRKDVRGDSGGRR